jgi:hypothetical protein
MRHNGAEHFQGPAGALHLELAEIVHRAATRAQWTKPANDSILDAVRRQLALRHSLSGGSVAARFSRWHHERYVRLDEGWRIREIRLSRMRVDIR